MLSYHVFWHVVFWHVARNRLKSWIMYFGGFRFKLFTIGNPCSSLSFEVVHTISEKFRWTILRLVSNQPKKLWIVYSFWALTMTITTVTLCVFSKTVWRPQNDARSSVLQNSLASITSSFLQGQARNLPQLTIFATVFVLIVCLFFSLFNRP